MEPETKNDCAGEGQQQITALPCPKEGAVKHESIRESLHYWRP
jgi:hypothetical protein